MLSFYFIIAIFLIISITGWIMMGSEAVIMGFFISCGIGALLFVLGSKVILEDQIMGGVESLGYMFNLVYALSVFVWLD